MSEIVWGDEIAVYGKRPEWLADHQEIMMFDGDWYGGTATKTQFYGRDVTHDEISIRLPADHPHYAKQSNVSEMETVRPFQQNAISGDVVERAVALVERVAGATGFATWLDHRAEARAIVALIEPVDADEAEAASVIYDHEADDLHAIVLAAIRRGRALAAEGR